MSFYLPPTTFIWNLCIYLEFRFLHFSLPLLPLPVFFLFLLCSPLCLSSPTVFSLCLPSTDCADNDLELSMVRHQPEGLDQLQAQTQFTRKELQSLYRGFKNVWLLLLLLGVVIKQTKKTNHALTRRAFSCAQLSVTDVDSRLCTQDTLLYITVAKWRNSCTQPKNKKDLSTKALLCPLVVQLCTAVLHEHMDGKKKKFLNEIREMCSKVLTFKYYCLCLCLDALMLLNRCLPVERSWHLISEVGSQQADGFLTFSLFRFVYFEQECPSGLVDEETFKVIYSQFFPQGGAASYNHPNLFFFCLIEFNRIFSFKGMFQMEKAWVTFEKTTFFSFPFLRPNDSLSSPCSKYCGWIWMFPDEL